MDEDCREAKFARGVLDGANCAPLRGIKDSRPTCMLGDYSRLKNTVEFINPVLVTRLVDQEKKGPVALMRAHLG